jgi:hypothetical protein
MNGSDRGRRLAVSVAAVALFIASDWVPSPVGLTGLMATIAASQPGPPIGGAFCLSMGAILDAAILVELLAFAVPRWRALRLSGPAGRARLWTATGILALALAAGQAYFMVRWLRRSGALGDELGTAALLIATMTAGVAVKLAAAQAVSRFGLGNGFSVLSVAYLLQLTIVEAARKQTEVFDQLSGPLAVRRLVLLAVVGAVVAWVFVRERRRAATGAALPFPASGMYPLHYAVVLPSMVANLGAMGVLDGLVKAFAERALWTQAIQVAIVVAGGVLAARLFNAPRRIAPAFPEPGRAILEGAARAVVFMLLLGAAHTMLTTAGVWFTVTSIIVVVAVGLDLHGEWHARVKERLIPVWPLARPYLTDRALAALHAAGIPAFPRGLQHRALLQAFGPYVTVDLLVPEARAAEAQQLLEASVPSP